jgi:hypothetical protein
MLRRFPDFDGFKFFCTGTTHPGDTLRINAQRIGYKPAMVDWADGNVLKKS